MRRSLLIGSMLLIMILTFGLNSWAFSQTYPVIDTGQDEFYDNTGIISPPQPSAPFYGQDAQFNGNQPSYTDNGDGTISDNVTGLMWQQSADMDGDGDIDAADKLSYDDAMAGASSFNLGGYDNWRLPTIKELYSLILFSGLDPSGWEGTDTDLLTPFIDTTYFDFAYGDVAAGERIIDAQYASATLYVSTTMLDDETMFGVNFADGRIKGYPKGPMPGQTEDKAFFVFYVRGNTAYGINDFIDNGDGTIADNATDLMWWQNDSEQGLNWEAALLWVQQKNSENFLGYSDWRLPNVKELQSIVDYTKSPATTNSAAIDSVFNCSSSADEGGSDNYPFYWTGTTHANMINGANAAYVCFGDALGWMQDPMGNYALLDVHGAGAQRSDPKTGDPDDYPYGHGPQGDVIRIYNYVRLVRGGEAISVGFKNSTNGMPSRFALEQNYPNPFNPTTTLRFELPQKTMMHLTVYDILGREVVELLARTMAAGYHQVAWNGQDRVGREVGAGIYIFQLVTPDYSEKRKMVLMK